MLKKDTQLVGYKLARTNWHQRTLLNKLFRKYDVSITTEQWVVLKIVAAATGISQTEIAARSLKDKTNITRIIDLLEKKKYIQRTKDDNDRRRCNISITSQGQSMLDTVIPVIKEGEAVLTTSLRPDEVETLAALLDKISLSIKAHT